MPKATSSRIIDAPLETVFDVVAHVENFPKAVPEIAEVEILGDIRSGLGTRFRETRNIKGRIVANEIEVTDYQPNAIARTEFVTGNIIWDSVFAVSPHADGTLLTLEMEAKPKKFLARLMLGPMMKIIRTHIESDMDAVKMYCENLKKT